MIRPSSYIPPEQYPANTAPENVPAFVAELPPVKVVRVWHTDGPLHENAQRTIARYVARDWRVQTVWTKGELLVPRSIPVPRAA